MPSHQIHPADDVYSVLRKSLNSLQKASKAKYQGNNPYIRPDTEGGDTEGYIDLLLIHAPWGGKEGRASNWSALARAQKEGWVRDIGVSNLYAKFHARRCWTSGARPFTGFDDVHETSKLTQAAVSNTSKICLPLNLP